MTKSNDDKRLEEGTKALFDESVERLDAATLSKLNQGRQAALAEVSKSGSHRLWARWLPATGLATAAALAIVMLRGPATIDELPVTDPALTDIELLLGEDELEMLEDLEFYSWIDVDDLEAADNVG